MKALLTCRAFLFEFPRLYQMVIYSSIRYESAKSVHKRSFLVVLTVL